MICWRVLVVVAKRQPGGRCWRYQGAVRVLNGLFVVGPGCGSAWSCCYDLLLKPGLLFLSVGVIALVEVDGALSVVMMWVAV